MNLVDLLRELVEIESPTGDTSEIQTRMAAELRATGAHVEPHGKHLYATVEGETFQRPTDVAWDRAGNIYVADGYGNARVAKYEPSGKYMKSWGDP